MAMVACDLGTGERKTGRALGSLAGLFRELHVRERHVSKGKLESMECTRGTTCKVDLWSLYPRTCTCMNTHIRIHARLD